MTAPSAVRVHVEKLVEGAPAQKREDSVAVEEPLEIRVAGKSLSVTMRTPGNDFELAAGFLFSEGVVSRAGQIAGVARLADGNPNIVAVELSGNARTKPATVQRAFVM